MTTSSLAGSGTGSDAAESYRLVDGCQLVTDQRGRRHLVAGLRSEDLGSLDQCGLATLRELAEGTYRQGPPTAMIDRLSAAGWLRVTKSWGDRRLYTIEPFDRPADREPPVVATPPVRLSRHAVLRRDGDDFLLESPRASCRVRVHDQGVRALLTGAERSGLPAALEGRLIADLWSAGFLTTDADEENAELCSAQWRTHELWFHQRSRAGVFGPGHGPSFVGGETGRTVLSDALASLGHGPTRWAADRFSPLPDRHEPYGGPVTPLYRPDLSRLRRHDVSLTTALEDRRSVRAHDDDSPITARQIGELLYRSAGVRAPVTRDGITRPRRAYPSGGGKYELELYLTVRLAEDIVPGLHYYDPFRHALVQVCETSPEVNRILGAAQRISAAPGPPQILLLVAARFGRVMWTYEEMAYSLILKHVGVLYQNLSIVTSAMGLAGCALGGGDPASFAAATGMDPLAESTVGEFMLGTPLPDSPADGFP